MKKYLSIYWLLVKLNISSVLAYRATLLNSLISSICWGLFQPLSFFLLTYRIKSSYGWTKGELLVLIGIFVTFWGLFHLFFSGGFQRLAETIDEGKLDGFLLKPVDSQFMLGVSIIKLFALVRVLIGVVFTFYIVYLYHIPITMIGFIISTALLFISLLLVYSIFFLFCPLMIWFYKLSNLINLLFNASGIMRYPSEMFKHMNIIFFIIFLPFMFMLGAPVKYFLNRGELSDIAWLIFFTAMFLFLSRKFWHYALKHYTSVNG